MSDWIVGYGTAAMVVVMGIWAAFATPLLKDRSDSREPPYSYARSQLFWWSLIITVTTALHYALTGRFPQFNNDTLILLGVSAGTTATGNIIDQRQDAVSAVVGASRNQDEDSEGWLRDILSDDSGVSVHRFQAVAFNAVYGLLFLGKFFSDPTHEFPEFGPQALLVMGLSASTYAIMKANENSPQRAEEKDNAGETSGKDGWVG